MMVAILTGFGAAALKHRWDVAADALRWDRERSERRRDELKSAFTGYLASRNSLDRALFFAARDRNLAAMDVVFLGQIDYYLSLVELQTILANTSFVEIEEELKVFPQWVQEMYAGMLGNENLYKPPPSDQSIVKLAQQVIRDQ